MPPFVSSYTARYSWLQKKLLPVDTPSLTRFSGGLQAIIMVTTYVASSRQTTAAVSTFSQNFCRRVANPPLYTTAFSLHIQASDSPYCIHSRTFPHSFCWHTELGYSKNNFRPALFSLPSFFSLVFGGKTKAGVNVPIATPNISVK